MLDVILAPRDAPLRDEETAEKGKRDAKVDTQRYEEIEAKEKREPENTYRDIFLTSYEESTGTEGNDA